MFCFNDFPGAFVSGFFMNFNIDPHHLWNKTSSGLPIQKCWLLRSPPHTKTGHTCISDRLNVSIQVRFSGSQGFSGGCRHKTVLCAYTCWWWYISVWVLIFVIPFNRFNMFNRSSEKNTQNIFIEIHSFSWHYYTVFHELYRCFNSGSQHFTA